MVKLLVSVTREIKVPYTHPAVEKVKKLEKADDGKVREVDVLVIVMMNQVQTFMSTKIVVVTVDGKQTRVTRKDGTAVDAKELPKLLEKTTNILVVHENNVDAETLKKIDEKTLVVRVPVPTVNSVPQAPEARAPDAAPLLPAPEVVPAPARK